MIEEINLQKVLEKWGYHKSKNNQFNKKFNTINCEIIVDFDKKEIIYPENKGFKITRRTTCNFSSNENFVVLECVTRLFDKGYRPENIEIEREWSLGHNKKSGFADIVVSDINNKTLFIIECKTYGNEYKKELKNLKTDGGQLFSYWQQDRNCKWLVLYASDFLDNEIVYDTESINCSDDKNIKNLAKKDTNIKIFENANTVEELFIVWKETYENRFSGDVIFRDDSIAYQIGVKPLRKKDLIDFAENNKVVNKFEEILRHNNISDKENAFNRLIALFICKLVDEIKKDDEMEVEFQYKIGTDTFESLQDRLQRLHKEGMNDFMDEEIFYVPDDYADKLVQDYTGHKRKRMIENLKENLRKLKFYTNNDFAFKDVHNEELFYQNGKVLVEVIQLFEKYKITNSKDLQMLGDLFEQLLNKGFKQNEGQFFTPMPITKFIWQSLPLDKIIKKESSFEYPKTIDFACGAGHFITQGYNTINQYFKNNNIEKIKDWEQNKLYGIEKDYRLARVSKISLFMNGAGKGNIKFGDGLENYAELNIKNESFDILVANPPYSVSAFKPHLLLKNNKFEILDFISNNGSEIETLFVERMSQLLKAQGVAAIVLPSTILNKTSESFIKAREIILENFKIKTIACFGSKTFGATGTNTIILFLEKFDYPPKQIDLAYDIVDSIFENRDLKSFLDEDIMTAYLEKIGVSKEDYIKFITKDINYTKWDDNKYFKKYLQLFRNDSSVKNKEKQSSFKKLDDNMQNKWYNQYFYNMYHKIEQEKLKYFALAYGQDTLIVMSPDGNKEQEEFLGYKWSNRKGQEGIQILNYGGILFNGNLEDNTDTISDVIKNSFSDIRVYNDKQEYYYYQKLSDMIDFVSTDFSKTINTNKIRIKKLKKGYKEYYLDDSKNFVLSIGNRVVDGDEIIDENGIYPIYSANVLDEMARTNEIINKKDLSNFELPSVLWGIDGDWIVNYIEENKPFYPTDHCGVLRVKNKNLLSEYISLALYKEGQFERFSRTNRASIDRVKSITIHAPSDIKEQQKIVDKINKFKNDITEKEQLIKDINNKVKSKFVEMFGEKETGFHFNKKNIKDYIKCQGGNSFNEMYQGNKNIQDIPFLKVSDMNNSSNLKYMTLSNNYVSEDIILNKIRATIFEEGTIIFPKVGMAILTNKKRILARPSCVDNNIMALWSIDENLLNNYLYYYLAYFIDLGTIASNGNPPSISTNSLNNILIPIPPKPLQDEFADFVKEQDKLKFTLEEEIKELNNKKEETINKYFN